MATAPPPAPAPPARPRLAYPRALLKLSGKTGEKVEVRRFARFELGGD